MCDPVLFLSHHQMNFCHLSTDMWALLLEIVSIRCYTVISSNCKKYLWGGKFTFHKRKVVLLRNFRLKCGSFRLFTKKCMLDKSV
jgi:hypothetical protein